MNSATMPLLIADIYELAGAWRRRGDEIARALGQTQARWQVLSAASPAAKTVPQIARRLGVSRQNVQRIADALVRDRLADFADNPDHRTSPHLVLTQAGEVLLAELSRVASARHAAVAAALDGIDLAGLQLDVRAILAAVLEAGPSSEKEKDND
jgi:DNA-binding MarR family transcriptional regulator